MISAIETRVMAPPAGFEPATIGLEGSIVSFRVRGASLNLGKDAVHANSERVSWSCLRGI